MRRTNVVRRATLTCALLLLPAAVWAQLSSSGVAGVVRDTSGAVLPGVTVEAASPALIEKVRTVVTDGQGRYNIVDLRIGTYVVTFSLPGFATVRREGIELPVGFTATVNAEMRVGALAETVTVTGASPQVDTQNTRQQTVVSSALLDVMPSGSKGMQLLVTLTAGMVGTADVGGSVGVFGLQNNGGLNASQGGMHGKASTKTMFDGMQINNMDHIGQTAGYIINALATQEMSVEMAGVSAESNSGGVAVNAIPKDGGNAFKGSVEGLFNNDRMQSDNLDDALRARGLTTVPKLLLNRDAGGTFGGPIKQDRLWFFTAHRWWGQQFNVAGVYHNKTQGTPFYTPDLDRPSVANEPYRSNVLRLTWQVSPRNKVSLFADNQDGTNPWAPENKAPESQPHMRYFPQGLYYVVWSSPRTNRLLFEAGVGDAVSRYYNHPRDGVTPSDIGIVELSTGFTYNAGVGVGASSGAYGLKGCCDRWSQRASVSYVTGSHAVKAGFQLQEGSKDTHTRVNGDVWYNFNRGVPSSLVQFATPNNQHSVMKADLGIYGQDQWTLKRLTLNAGLRFDYFNAYVPAQHLTAGQFVPARDFAPVYNVPLWKDLNPRLGAAYDLFGTGKTALKVSLGRYVALQSAILAELVNPVTTSVLTVTRTWNDANGNYVPDCDLPIFTANGECGQVSDLAFGQEKITTRWADDVLLGSGVRAYDWSFATEVQHEIAPGVSVNGGYYRTWFGNFTVADNLAVTPEDFSPYCITAPIDARLPSGGGYQVCGLYDVSVAKFGQVNNLVTQSSHYGKETQVAEFFNASFNARLRSGLRFGGGVDTGRQPVDACFNVDSPGVVGNLPLWAGVNQFFPPIPFSATTIDGQRACQVTKSFLANLQVKLNGSYEFPREFVVSSVFQNVAGPPILADYAAPNAQIAPSLGRNLAACGTRAVCTATATVPLVRPYTQFEGRRTQLDVRLTKLLNVGPRARLQANLDVYNVLNSNAILLINTNYGAAWRRPTLLLPGRVVQVSGTLTF